MQKWNQSSSNKAVSAAVVGNVLEWYDFAVYAFVAGSIAKQFFPESDDVTALLSTFLAYGLGFVARPLGGIFIGRLGDRRGRKAALMLTIFMMAAGTVMIGILPTYASLGLLAPLLLVVARVHPLAGEYRIPLRHRCAVELAVVWLACPSRPQQSQ